MKPKQICILLLFLPLFLKSQSSTRGMQSQQPQTKAINGNTYAIIVGISNYPYIHPLSFADKDAELFRDFIESPAGGNVKSENIKILINENAKAADFWVKGMSWILSKELKAGDRLYLYFAGHGDAIDQNEYFFLAYDCNPEGDKNNYEAS